MTNIHFIVSIIHILIIGPLFIYIGIVKPINILFYVILTLFAIIISISFIYKYIYKKLYEWLYIHLLLFASLLFYISYLKFTKQIIPNFLYSLLIAIGFGALGYHIVKLIKLLNI